VRLGHPFSTQSPKDAVYGLYGGLYWRFEAMRQGDRVDRVNFEI
jgi:hypothetical protein